MNSCPNCGWIQGCCCHTVTVPVTNAEVSYTTSEWAQPLPADVAANDSTQETLRAKVAQLEAENQAYWWDAKMTDMILRALECERTEGGAVNGPKAAAMIRELQHVRDDYVRLQENLKEVRQLVNYFAESDV